MAVEKSLSQNSSNNRRFLKFAPASTIFLFIVNIFINYGDEFIIKHIFPREAGISLRLTSQDEKPFALADLLSKKGSDAANSAVPPTEVSQQSSFTPSAPQSLAQTLIDIKNSIKDTLLSVLDGNLYKEFSSKGYTPSQALKTGPHEAITIKTQQQTKVTLPLPTHTGRNAISTNTTHTSQAKFGGMQANQKTNAPQMSNGMNNTMQGLPMQPLHMQQAHVFNNNWQRNNIPQTPNGMNLNLHMFPVQQAHVFNNPTQPQTWQTWAQTNFSQPGTFQTVTLPAPQRAFHQAIFSSFSNMRTGRASLSDPNGTNTFLPYPRAPHFPFGTHASADTGNNLDFHSFDPRSIASASNVVSRATAQNVGFINSQSGRATLSDSNTTNPLLPYPSRAPRFPFQMRAAAEGGKKFDFEKPDDRDPPPMGGVVSGARSQSVTVKVNDDSFSGPIPNSKLNIPPFLGLQKNPKPQPAKVGQVDTLKAEHPLQGVELATSHTKGQASFTTDPASQQMLDYPHFSFGPIVQTKHTHKAHTQSLSLNHGSGVDSAPDTQNLLDFPKLDLGDLLSVSRAPQGPNGEKQVGKILNVKATGKPAERKSGNTVSEEVLSPMEHHLVKSTTGRPFTVAIQEAVKNAYVQAFDAPLPTQLPLPHFHLGNLLSILSSKQVMDAADKLLDSLGFGKIISIHKRGDRFVIQTKAKNKNAAQPNQAITVPVQLMQSFLPRMVGSFNLKWLSQAPFDAGVFRSLLGLVHSNDPSLLSDANHIGKVIGIHQTTGKIKSPNDQTHQVEEVAQEGEDKRP